MGEHQEADDATALDEQTCSSPDRRDQVTAARFLARRAKVGARLAVAALVVVGALIALSRDPGDQPLRALDGMSGAMPSEGAGTYSALWVGDLCTTAKDATGVQILDVEPHKGSGGLRVTDFSVYTHGATGDDPGAVEDSRIRDVPAYAAGNDVVSVHCTVDSSPRAQGLAIEAYKPTAVDTTVAGFNVTYRSGRTTAVLLLRADLRFCNDFGSSGCGALPPTSGGQAEG